MALALDGVDLVALAGCFLLIGLLAAVGYTFTRLADVLDVSIFGYHPFSGIASAIRNTIVAGCNAGISALQKAVHDLWYGMEWSIKETVNGLVALADGVHGALDYMWSHALARVIHAITDPLNRAVTAVDARVDTLARDVTSDVLRLDARITTDVQAALHTAEKDIHDATRDTLATVGGELATLRSTVEGEISQGVASAETTAAQALAALARVESEAITAVGQAEALTGEELRKLIARIPFTDIAAVIAAVPLLKALVQTLEAESGLDSAECRQKVKGICRTNPHAWGKLVGLLALEAEWPGINELADGIAEMASEVVGAIEELVGV